MPLTPPDYYDSYPTIDRGINQLPTLRSGGHIVQPSTYEIRRAEEHESTLPRYSQYNVGQPSRTEYPGDIHRQAAQGYTMSQGSSSIYNVGNAPTLPPIRIPDPSLADYQHNARTKRAAAVTQPKEEKSMGGVAAHLDYEMEDMVDFVSQHAQGMYEIYTSKFCLADIDMTRSVMNSEASVHPDFRKYVSQILSSTRLPCSSLLLGL